MMTIEFKIRINTLCLGFAPDDYMPFGLTLTFVSLEYMKIQLGQSTLADVFASAASLTSSRILQTQFNMKSNIWVKWAPNLAAFAAAFCSLRTSHPH